MFWSIVQNRMTYYDKISAPGKKMALLIDPDKMHTATVIATLHVANESGICAIFVGGSLTHVDCDKAVSLIKQHTNIPVFLFPGGVMQLTNKADALLFLSLVSGRNAEYLIGNHVQSARYIKDSGLEAISTGYILIDGGIPTSVEYISNTRPIPANKPDLVVATSVASELLGHKLIYLEAGSGARNPVSPEIIREVAKNVNVPLIVGGGINTPEKVSAAFEAGADLIVVGTAVEKNIQNLDLLTSVVSQFN